MEKHPLRAYLKRWGTSKDTCKGIEGGDGVFLDVNFMKSLQGGLRGILGGSWERSGPSLGVLGGSLGAPRRPFGSPGATLTIRALALEGLGGVSEGRKIARE